jgi:DNA polymerase I
MPEILSSLQKVDNEIRPGKPLLFVGEAPGAHERDEGCPFVGPAGRVLMSAIERAGLERSECSFANVFPWFRSGNPTPTPSDMLDAEPYLNEAIASASPKVVIALGSTATARLVGMRSVHTWRGSLLAPPTRAFLGNDTVLDHDNPFKSGPRKGQPRPKKVDVYASNMNWRCPVMVTLHPSGILRSGYEDFPLLVLDIQRAWRMAQGDIVSVGGELNTDASAETVINALSQVKIAALDYETEGRLGDVTALGFAFDENTALVLQPTEYRRAFKPLQKVFGDPSRGWIGHNVAYELMVAKHEDTPIKGKVFDTMHAAHFDRPDLPKGLDSVASRIHDLRYHNWKAEFREGRLPDLYLYNALDCCYTHALYTEYIGKLKRQGQWEHFNTVLMPLTPILAEMEMTGVRVDRAVRDRLYDKYSTIVDLQAERWDKLSEGVNPASPKQLQEYFYSTLGLPTQYLGRGRGRKITTNKEALVALHDSFPDVEALDALIKWRAASKIKSTYLENVDGDRVYPGYNISNTLTGRLSGGGDSGINFQNIPAEIRAMFVAEEGDVGLACADWSQIEYRLSALLAHDAELLQAYEEGDREYLKTGSSEVRFDIHQAVADSLGLPRKKAKRIVHGTNYGMQAATLAKHAGISVREAKHYLELFKIKYPVLERHRTRVIHEAKKKGYITNPFSRRLVFKVTSAGKVDAPKVLAAGPQSTAADMMLIALIRAHRAGLKVRWTVHDELGVSMTCPQDAHTLKEVMEQPFEQLGGFWCPADVDTGQSWLEAKGE